tara:strand:+ start:40 stop:705 length:666 start_codon:yes stop_codon:yes gene_type:complete
MAEFDYVDTPFGELEYLLPNFESMMRNMRPDVTANLANRADVGTGYIDSIIGADGVIGQSTANPRYGLSYKDNDDLDASIIYNQNGREANINAGLLGGNAYAKYFKDNANNSTLQAGYENPKGGFSVQKDSDMGNEYAANIRPTNNTSLAFEKNDATKKLMAEYYPDNKSSLFAQAVNTDNGTGYNVGYNNQLTDNSNVKANYNRNPDGNYIAQLMLELGF